MAVNIYRYNDTGAPTKPASASYNAAKWIMDILKACLVTGYGSKPGAGWTIGYEDSTTNANRMSFKNGNGEIEFVTWGTQSIGVFIWDSVTSPGTGRLYDTAWSTAVSTGVNGWSAQSAKLPNATVQQVAGMNANSGLSSVTEAQWTVFADDKFCWLVFHCALDSANAQPGDDINNNTSFHPKLAFGALRSPDLGRNQFGNFSLLYGAASAASATGVNASAQHYLTKLIALRTPLNLAPSANTEINYSQFKNHTGNNLNHKSSVRLITPIIVYYTGSDLPKAAGAAVAYNFYTFAQVPGVVQVADVGAGAEFWGYYSAEYAVSSNLEMMDIGGLNCMAAALFTATASNSALTDNAAWW